MTPALPAHDYPWTASDPVEDLMPRPETIEGRRLVIGVGSNASADVMRAKLATVATGEPGPPMMRVSLAHLAVGHSAHVSARGYVPAAPYRAPGEILDAVGAWLTEEEATMLDHTEPNYRRIELSADEYPFFSADSAPDSFSLYAPRHGVLTDPDSTTPVPLGSQSEVIEWLAARLPDRALHGSADEVCRRLGEPRIGARVSASMQSAGLARPSGLPSPEHETGPLSR
ncbi:hypothetical protein VZC37_19755 [Gordonia sp. LSe1-13]|uniref:2-amino-4-hydroxy-6-hydroxymethyldihydropteridine pyrophosphokinase n=1 Tax=Gordonia sesuvii TaxID=3116777 RepID=A0ABU7MIX4_9ACTN|nr:hypothetical protein [Gordonia sp. LSe1-13]